MKQSIELTFDETVIIMEALKRLKKDGDCVQTQKIIDRINKELSYDSWCKLKLKSKSKTY